MNIHKLKKVWIFMIVAVLFLQSTTRMVVDIHIHPVTALAAFEAPKALLRSGAKMGGQDMTRGVAAKPVQYRIVFDKNDPKGFLQITGDMKMIAGVAYGVEKTLPANHYISQKGYVFSGWNTKPDGSGTSYGDKAKVKNLSSKDGEKIILYAQWADGAGRNVTASIFSTGTLGMWSGLILLVVCGVIIGCYVSVKKQKKI